MHYFNNSEFTGSTEVVGVSENSLFKPEDKSQESFNSVQILILVAVLLMILATIIGNVFVISAIYLEKTLRTPTNYLILSLAATDFLVAVCVMPLSLINEIWHQLILKPSLCFLWIILDVDLCTVSIFHLLVISVDRFRSVTNIKYQCHRSIKKSVCMVALCWSAGLIVCAPLVFRMQAPENDPNVTGVCIIDQSIAYTIFSTLTAFYIPGITMVTIYCNIYKVARSSIRKTNLKKFQKNSDVNRRRNSDTDIGAVNFGESRYIRPKSTNIKLKSMKYIPTDGLNRGRPLSYAIGDELPRNRDFNLSDGKGIEIFSLGTRVLNHYNFDEDAKQISKSAENILNFKEEKKKLESRRERRAARMLGIITGAFIICWLPFFIVALISPVIGDKVSIPEEVRSFVLWLGYFNSLINPVLYTVFSVEFRKSFKKILNYLYCMERFNSVARKKKRCCSSTSRGSRSTPVAD